MASIVGTCLGSAMLVLGSGNVVWTVAGTVVAGVSFGPIFPTIVVMGTEVFRGAPSRAVSVIISLGSLGGMVLPPLQGLLLERVNPLASVTEVFAACVGMLLLFLAVERGAHGESNRSPAAQA
jgi:fucose permease